MPLPIEQACYWLARRPPRPFRTLESHEEVTVAVVGGGLTGLWTALFLRELDPAATIVVVEQSSVAYGASGRNAGMLSETVDHSHSLAIEHFGAAEAQVLARLGESNVAEMIGFLQSHAINCEYEPTGRLMVSLTTAQVEEARRGVETAERLGVRSFHFLDRAAVQSEVHSPLYLGGVAVEGGGILDPVKLVEGLRAEAERQGIKVYEHSAVVAIELDGAGIVLRTTAGAVRAENAVLATSAYTHHLLPSVTYRFIPLYDYIMVSEPLSPAQRESIGWHNRQGITDTRTFFNYYRLTADNRVLWGTSEATYYSGNSVGPGCDHSPAHYESLRLSWIRHFPALADLRWEYHWGGAICSTTRMTPFFGKAMEGRLHYGLGFTGHGLGTTRLAGRILAHLVLKRPSELLELSLVTRQPFPYPPEPFRTWAVNAVTGALRKVDQGETPSLLLRVLQRMGIGFSS